MSLKTILSIVPKPARTTATVIMVLAVLTGIALSVVEETVGSPSGVQFPILFTILGFFGGLFVGCLFAIWVLGLGYVYADARRRNMPHIPWTLIAAIVPNLLGFLLYFVLRKPLAFPCRQCGQPVAADQRFCPACGCQAVSPSAPTAPPQPI